jgi:hypothetical protein
MVASAIERKKFVEKKAKAIKPLVTIFLFTQL